MDKDSTSFWADIKKFEDTLSRDPMSYCFAPLSEVYRRLGLLDDAIATAKRGVEVHPEYVGGFMALGRAYYEKGMRQEAREALEKVVRATPENLLAQKLLSQLFLEEGNLPAAEQALRILTSFNPEDTESRIALESLQRAKSSPEGAGLPADDSERTGNEQAASDYPEDENELGAASLEDFAASFPTEHEEDDLVFDEEVECAEPATGGQEAEPAPLSTITLAELYEKQGYGERALAVYRELLLQDPENMAIKQRVAALQGVVEGDSAEFSFASGREGDEASVLPHQQSSETVSAFDATGMSCDGAVSRPVGREEVIETLEKWLDSIRRERACR